MLRKGKRTNTSEHIQTQKKNPRLTKITDRTSGRKWLFYALLNTKAIKESSGNYKEPQG